VPGATLTIGETVTSIRSALQDYIEATYHVGHPTIVAQRRVLLDEEGILYRAPYIESTPRYQSSRHFAKLDLPAPALSLLSQLADPPGEASPLVFDPPYTHQATALEAVCAHDRSLVVTTGTGSGKTETFLLPILAKFAAQAAERPDSFKTPALRALLLYPMNALVNDQLGRLRLLFGSPLVTSQFAAWAGRPARFARYTSRTLYPGVRTTAKDSRRLASIQRFYITLLEQASDDGSPYRDQARSLIDALQARGKWPAKPDMRAWFGPSGSRWKNRAGEFVRAVTLPEDPELFTRHEVLANPPDILVTNYSMLEYMLMRPLERPVFDATRTWLADNPEERLLLVIDEAHMYRGAAGAEVALLLRRLRARLEIDQSRLQVICTSASFHDSNYARGFAAQLSGKDSASFVTVEGKLAKRPYDAIGTRSDAQALGDVDLDAFYNADDDTARAVAVSGFLAYRGCNPSDDYRASLCTALEAFPPLSRLVNLTMSQAMPLGEIAAQVFAVEEEKLANRALTTLIALGSVARRAETEAGLLPCRVHGFFRGLPGLWACVDPECELKSQEHAESPIGRLYPQPVAQCDCGARVFELYTCRNCGSAYARAYTNDIESPTFLWNEPGSPFEAASGHVGELLPLDLLLEEPTVPVEVAELDLVTGRLNPMVLGERTRQVSLRVNRMSSGTDADDDDGSGPSGSGEFNPCGVCDTRAGFGRSSVQDHQTKGDQPFQALVTRQIEVQPPSPQAYSEFAPLRGRKVLVFSDSRQTAARLAPNLQTYSMQDVIRPLILRGWRTLQAQPLLADALTLDHLFLAALVASDELSVRLRPELKATESLRVMNEVAEAMRDGALNGNPPAVMDLIAAGQTAPPQTLLRGIVSTITDRYYGLQSLALASIREKPTFERAITALPGIAGVAESFGEKLALGRLWLSQWVAPTAGIWFNGMDISWIGTNRGVRPHSGKFTSFDRWLGDKAAKKAFDRDWLPVLLERFCQVQGAKHQILARTLALDTSQDWGYCQACRTTQRSFPGTSVCTNCRRDRVVAIEPDNDPVFTARKGYYRGSSVRALSDPPSPPMAIVAAEHTAQLNAAQSDEVFSKAEEHELLFQDVNIALPTPGQRPSAAIDVLSCTTTMEVGIDIGTLSGVALRNMPPSRANYQQRAGRAGRRGNSVATVIAFGSADSHDEHYFSEPDAMIRGSVNDPTLTLDNVEIARRHVTAYLFQRYHQARLPEIAPDSQPQLFEVLGHVDSFLSPSSPLNRNDFAQWMRDNETDLVRDISGWLPEQLAGSDRARLLDEMVVETLLVVDGAIGFTDPAAASGEAANRENDDR
jgi:Lhr-like helicase